MTTILVVFIAVGISAVSVLYMVMQDFICLGFRAEVVGLGLGFQDASCGGLG